jgi:hypothetical protein
MLHMQHGFVRALLAVLEAPGLTRLPRDPENSHFALGAKNPEFSRFRRGADADRVLSA